MDERLNVRETLSSMWACLRNHFALLFGVSFVYMSIPTLISLFLNGTVVQILFVQVAGSFMACGYYSILLKLARNEPADALMLFSKTHLFWKYLIANVLTCAACVLGLVAIVLPSIYLGIRLGQFPLPIADEQCGPIESLKESWAITRGCELKLFLLFLITGGFAIISCILLGLIVGLVSNVAGWIMHMTANLTYVTQVTVGVVMPICLLPMMLTQAFAFDQLAGRRNDRAPHNAAGNERDRDDDDDETDGDGDHEEGD